MKGTAEKLFQVTLHDDITVIHISKEVRDKERIMEFGDDLVAYIEEHRPSKVQMNFEYVLFFGSEAISALIRAQLGCEVLVRRSVSIVLALNLVHE